MGGNRLDGVPANPNDPTGRPDRRPGPGGSPPDCPHQRPSVYKRGRRYERVGYHGRSLPLNRITGRKTRKIPVTTGNTDASVKRKPR